MNANYLTDSLTNIDIKIGNLNPDIFFFYNSYSYLYLVANNHVNLGTSDELNAEDFQPNLWSSNNLYFQVPTDITAGFYNMSFDLSNRNSLVQDLGTGN